MGTHGPTSTAHLPAANAQLQDCCHVGRGGPQSTQESRDGHTTVLVVQKFGVQSFLDYLCCFQAEVRGAHEGVIWTMAWHPAGHILATGSGDTCTKFWGRAQPGDPWRDRGQQEQEANAATEGKPWQEPN